MRNRASPVINDRKLEFTCSEVPSKTLPEFGREGKITGRNHCGGN